MYNVEYVCHFLKKKYHFPYGYYISGTYMNSISVLQIHKKRDKIEMAIEVLGE